MRLWKIVSHSYDRAQVVQFILCIFISIMNNYPVYLYILCLLSLSLALTLFLCLSTIETECSENFF